MEGRARILVEQDSDSGLAWTLLGTSLLSQGKDALPALQKAAELLPEDAGVHSNLGNALHTLGRHQEAVANYCRALEINPDYAEAHNNLGNTLKSLGQLDDAVLSYRRALEIKPDFAEAHSNLGNALKDLGQLDDAVAHYRRALEIKPDFIKAHSNLGNTLRDLGRLDEAVTSYRRVLETAPDLADIHNNLGNALKALGKFDDAAVSFHRALEINPDFAEAYSNLGSALKGLWKLDSAVSCYRRALEIKPDFPEAHNNLGNAQKDLGLINDAALSYRRALEIKPDFVEAYYNLGNTLLSLGQLDDAVLSYRRALEIKPDYVNAFGNLLFTYNYMSKEPGATLLAEARRYGNLVARQARFHGERRRNVIESGKCLRVGFVSGDLRTHSVGYFVEGMLAALANHASGQLELIAYSNHFESDELTERIKASCHGWHWVAGLSDERLVRRILDDGIDILIDLSGHTAHNRLPMFAWKPAPVQVSWLGYFATTGVAAMDYFIADPWTLPDPEEAFFTEKIWRLPETRLCFTPPNVDVSVSGLPALTNGYITFGCFNNLSKMNDNVVALWARVLASVPNSRLFLKSKQLNDDPVKKNTISRFAAHGISAARLILEGPELRKEYLAAYRRVDIALDPFPFPGGTTSVEGLWMGVPVLTLAGERFLSRQGGGILMNAGLPGWIAVDADDYVSRAVFHAANLRHLSDLRDGLRQQVLASPIFDAPRFAKNFEAALRSMWKKWCDDH